MAKKTFYIEIDGNIRTFDTDERKLRMKAQMLGFKDYKILSTTKVILTDNVGHYYFKGNEPEKVEEATTPPENAEK